MSRLCFFTCLVLLCLGIGLLVSCSGDDDDDNDAGDSGNQDVYSPCKETTTTLANIDEVSSLLGIPAADLLAEVGNGFTTTALYAVDTSVLTQWPLGGETSLTVTISYDGGEIRQIESQPAEGENQNEIGFECLHRMEIDVSVGFSTEDGAFAETWQAVLAQSIAAEQVGLDDPYLSAEFDPAGIAGSFEILSIAGETPDSVTGALYATAVDPFQGSLDILVEQTHGEGEDGTVSQSRHVALSWGAAQ